MVRNLPGVQCGVMSADSSEWDGSQEEQSDSPNVWKPLEVHYIAPSVNCSTQVECLFSDAPGLVYAVAGDEPGCLNLLTDVNGLSYVHMPETESEVGKQCFERHQTIKAVVFSSKSIVYRIGRYAFRGSTLVSLCIPDSVEVICRGAFAFCKLEVLTFSAHSRLRKIGRHAFCLTDIIDLRLPDGVEKVGEMSFRHCRKVRSIDGVINHAREIGPHAFAGSNVPNVTVPDDVNCIGHGWFRSCKSLKHVNFGLKSCARYFDDLSFKESGIEVFVVPDSVEYIGRECFSCCSSLRHVHFGHSSCLHVVYEKAFYNSSLVEISLPSSLVKICDFCFCECKSLKRVIFGQESCVSVLCQSAFSSSGLESICIPSSVCEIGESCFKGCSDLRFVNFSDCSSLCFVGLDAFFGCCFNHFAFPNDSVVFEGNLFGHCVEDLVVSSSFMRKEGGSIVLRGSSLFCVVGRVIDLVVPDYVCELCDRCFSGYDELVSLRFGRFSSLCRLGRESLCNTSISNIIIPDSVIEIGERCFYGCSKLISVMLNTLSCLLLVGADAFRGCQMSQLVFPREITVQRSPPLLTAKLGPEDLLLITLSVKVLRQDMFTLKLSPLTTAGEVKEIVANKLQFPLNTIIMTWGDGWELRDDALLGNYAAKDQCWVNVEPNGCEFARREITKNYL